MHVFSKKCHKTEYILVHVTNIYRIARGIWEINNFGASTHRPFLKKVNFLYEELLYKFLFFFKKNYTDKKFENCYIREHFSFFDFDLYIITYGCVKLDNAQKRGSNGRSCRKKGRLRLELVISFVCIGEDVLSPVNRSYNVIQCRGLLGWVTTLIITQSESLV